MIKRTTSIVLLVMLGILSSYSQATIIDFDSISYDANVWNGIIEITTNPAATGINTSANVARYTTPADKAWSNCAVVTIRDTIHYELLDSLQFMVLAPSATLMFVKLEDAGRDGEIQPSAYATPIESSDWQTITLKFSGLSGADSIDAVFNRLSLFFNVNDLTGGEDWFFDNVVAYPTEAVPPSSIDTTTYEPADLARIFKTMDKGRRGEDLTIGVIGGSITQGYAASSENTRWTNLMTDWWEDKFPSSNIKLINAGWGGTGSDIGAHRVYDDLLKDNPDFIVVEFSVNDAEGEHAKKMMEGLVQQILSAENTPGLSILMLKQVYGTTAQASHKPVAQHYKVPYVSFVDLIDAKVQEDDIELSSIFVDGLHPNDVGMAYIAEMIHELLDSIYALLPEENNLPDVDTQLPAPIIGDTYSNTKQYFNNTIDPLSNTGWETSTNGWTTTEANNQIDFKLTGNALSLVFTKNDENNRGRAEVWVDDGPAHTIDAYMSADWGTQFTFSLVQEGLSDGEHILHIKSIDESSTSGNKVNISRILAAGNIQENPTFVQDLKENKAWVNIYPNPAKDIINVQYYVSESQDISIQILDLQGKCIWNKLITNPPLGMNEYSIEIDPSRIKPDLYLIQIGDSKTSKAIQVFIN